MSARIVHDRRTTYQRQAFQEWCLDHDRVYLENYHRLVRNQRADAGTKAAVSKWLLRSSTARLRRAGLLTKQGTPVLNSVGQALPAMKLAA